MIEDIGAVVWKELREARRQPTAFVGAFVLLGLLGILVPAQTGAEFIRSPFAIMTWIAMPLAMIITTIADSFAGERERHTLETLLSTRLSDDAILAGKLLASVGIAAVLVVAQVAIAIVTVNVAAPGAGFPSALFLVEGYALAIACALLFASVGILVSLRASTVRQAQQALGIVIAILGAGASTSPAWLPASWKRELVVFAATRSQATLLACALGILAAFDVLLLAACRARFRRARLVLGS